MLYIQPIIMFTKTLFCKSNKIHIACDDDICSICISEITPNDKLTTQCGHHFHTTCFKKSLTLCPNCRAHVVLNTEPCFSQYIEHIEQKCSKWIDYSFTHHFFVSLVLAVPIGYTCLIGYITYKIGKLITYPIWHNFVKVGSSIQDETHWFFIHMCCVVYVTRHLSYMALAHSLLTQVCYISHLK